MNTKAARTVILVLGVSALNAVFYDRAAWACPQVPVSVPRIEGAQIKYLGFDRDQGYRNVSFSGSASYDPDGGPIVEYTWSYQASPFPDEYRHHQWQFIKTYYEPGAYTEIKLWVKDDEEQTGMNMCHLYLVEPILKVSFGGQWMEDPDEYIDGAFVLLNDDDDNDNGIPDNNPNEIHVAGENDLLDLYVYTEPAAGWLEQGSLTLEIVSGASRITVWRRDPAFPHNLSVVVSSSQPSKTWAIGDVLGETFLVEGVALSGSLRDVELKLTYACASGTSVDRVRLTVLKVEFQARDGKVNYGFDPREALWTGGPYPWASVDKDGSSDVPKIVIEPSEAATRIELNVAAGGDYADINPKTFTAGSTDLTIEGQGQAGDALVEAKIVGTNMVCERLNIIARPKRTVNVGIYRIQDPTSPGTVFPQDVPTDNQIINTLNDVFKQAVVEFELDESSGQYDIEYDTTKLPYILEEHRYTPGQDGKWQEGEQLALFVEQPSPWTADVDVFLLRENGDWLSPDQAGWISGNPVVHIMVFTHQSAGRTELVVAHEIGHRLGLSTKDDDGAGHDGGPWPQGQKSLMISAGVPGRWLRHEDWNKANQKAGEL